MALTTEFDSGMIDFDQLTFPVAAAVKIFAGSIVVLNASGYAQPGTTATGLKSLGRACRTIDNLAGLAGAVKVSAEVSNSTKWFWFLNDTVAPVTIADLLANVYIKDDNTVTITASGHSVVGKAMAIRNGMVGILFPQ